MGPTAYKSPIVCKLRMGSKFVKGWKQLKSSISWHVSVIKFLVYWYFYQTSETSFKFYWIAALLTAVLCGIDSCSGAATIQLSSCDGDSLGYKGSNIYSLLLAEIFLHFVPAPHQQLRSARQRFGQTENFCSTMDCSLIGRTCSFDLARAPQPLWLL